MRVSFLHLDLGVGGAERLVVDAACALKLSGHSVLVLTSHHDQEHCFEETMICSEGLICRDVRCTGDWLPRYAFGKRFHLVFAILRMMYVAHFFSPKGKGAASQQPDVYIVDQVSFVIPFARWCLPPGTPILFYLHFPDKLIAHQKDNATGGGGGGLGVLKRAYRMVFDWLEEYTTRQADRIVVNSNFTLSVMRQAFPSLNAEECKVLYPCVDLDQFDRAQQVPASPQFADLLAGPLATGNFVLSINRFERKKNLELAIEAFALVHEQHPTCRLVVTGGYDDRVEENVHYCQELKQLALEYQLDDSVVVFWINSTQSEKRALLDRCRVLVYTPQDEHFGIVPIEAGAARKPAICCNSGGPLETIVHGETGLLCEPSAVAFAQAMETFVNEQDGAQASQKLGRQARARVEQLFSRVSFGENLEQICREMMVEEEKKKNGKRAARRSTWWWWWLLAFVAVCAACVFLAVATSTPGVLSNLL